MVGSREESDKQINHPGKDVLVKFSEQPLKEVS